MTRATVWGPRRYIRRRSGVRAWSLVLAASVWTLTAGLSPAVAQDYPQPDLAQVRSMVACGTRFLSDNQPEAIIPILQQKKLAEPFKQALLRVMSPGAPNREAVLSLDMKQHNAVGALLHLVSIETLRGPTQVDKTPSNAAMYVLHYYMALAAGEQAGEVCSLSASTREWMDGMAFEKFAKHDDVMGVPFQRLDDQQAELNACVSRAMPDKSFPAERMARVLAVDSVKRQALEKAARSTLFLSNHLGELNGLDRVPFELFEKRGMKTPEEGRVYGVLSTIYTASVDEPDYGVRMKSRLLYEYYRMLASKTSCTVPKESLAIIESLHADH